ncbi:phosphoglycolate phosphatase [Shewanella algicola]|uniref:Phosphoglycolate phosphatase n=1 Tax=Shewanella algicola TaxID=640633 RepID=A0A9X2CAH9_9GAMM|nr:phosphoglycolate phosphatase [Shewanella algicola]MCL1106000.1 phosphoglycolate phosphatase [Shewanella algicola]GGP56998.1 phosphoglycolate phosphatase [Shewanella algicola]
MSQWANIKAIAFDLDGTLIDSVPDLAAATNATLVECNLPEVSDALVRSWVGNGAQILMQRALSYASSMAEDSTALQAQLEQVMPRFMHHYGEHLQQHSLLYPHVLETLQQLTQAGYKLAIVTNKPYRFTVPLLTAFGLDGLFSEVLGGDSLAKMKPDPMPLQHLLQQWQLDNTQLLMVGDSKNDILAAKAANVMSIGLTYGYNYGEDIGLSEPDAVCEQFADIGNYLQSQ